MKGVPFREAHSIVGRLVGWCIENKITFAEMSLEQWQEHIPFADSAMTEILTVRESVRRRNVYGGTGFVQVRIQIEEAKPRI